MKKILSISLGSKKYDYEFKTQFLGKSFFIKRLGTDGNIDLAADMLIDMQHEYDAIGLASLNYKKYSGIKKFFNTDSDLLKRMIKEIKIPVTTGQHLRKVAHQWTIDHIQHRLGNYFDNIRVLFLSGVINSTIIEALSEYTDNLVFADLLLDHGIPRLLNSINEFKIYSKGINNALEFFPSKIISKNLYTITSLNDFLFQNAIKNANVIVIPNNMFFDYIKDTTLMQLSGKIIITSTVYDERLTFLRQRNVNVVIDATPKVLERIVGFNILEAMIILFYSKTTESITSDDFLEVICENAMAPRIIYPSGKPKRVNRFAYICHLDSNDYYNALKSNNLLSKMTSSVYSSTLSKFGQYSKPFIYSKISGIKSLTGIEAEGWIIYTGSLSEDINQKNKNDIHRRFIEAAKYAKKLGAQIAGFGPFSLSIEDSLQNISKEANIAITNGASCVASGALWAAADAVRRLKLVKKGKEKKLKAKTMVVGAIEPIGSVCAHLLAKAFENIYMIDTRDARLLALRQDILHETPNVEIQIATRADKYVKDMDLIVIAKPFENIKKKFDIMSVKPGCVITDMTRPVCFSIQELEKRPDILYIKSGEIMLPGNPEMNNIGLPPGVVNAELAETITLALEARFEIFSEGKKVEWQKVREIYRMGLKHGMKLAAISDIEGVISDKKISSVREKALKSINT